jgi:hypothetical protein
VALLVVIGVTAAVTISVTRDEHGDGGPTPSGDTFGLASADDKGPVNIITEDPSCAAWGPIAQTFIDVERRQGWNVRDPSVPAANWTPQQRDQYATVAKALRAAADQTVAIAKLTPHRVMREYYDQFIAYARAYADAIPRYIPSDDHLARVFTSSQSAIADICKAITYGSAKARSPLVPSAQPPTNTARLADPASPQRLIDMGGVKCSDWTELLEQFDADTKQWQSVDPAIAASGWSPEEKAAIDSTVPVMKKMADDMEKLGFSSSNPVVQDFAVLAAQYRRAYAEALPTYTIPDSFLSGTASETTSIIWEACKAGEG